jgi:hypothetical protein
MDFAQKTNPFGSKPKPKEEKPTRTPEEREVFVRNQKDRISMMLLRAKQEARERAQCQKQPND